MSIKLHKGERVSLTKGNPLIQHLTIGLGWDMNKFVEESGFDLDASAFLLNSNKKCSRDQDFVFYGNLNHPSGAIVHSGDNRTGSGDGDDEFIEVNLNKIPLEYKAIAFSITIYDAESREQNFDMISNAYIRVLDTDTDKELVRYELSDAYARETALVIGELRRCDDGWRFYALDDRYTGGLSAICAKYGIDAE